MTAEAAGDSELSEFEMAQASLFDMTDLADPWPKYRELLDAGGHQRREVGGLGEGRAA